MWVRDSQFRASKLDGKDRIGKRKGREHVHSHFTVINGSMGFSRAPTGATHAGGRSLSGVKDRGSVQREGWKEEAKKVEAACGLCSCAASTHRYMDVRGTLLCYGPTD